MRWGYKSTPYFLDLLRRRNLLANFAVTLDLSEDEPGHKFLYKSGSSSGCDDRERRGSRGPRPLAEK